MLLGGFPIRKSSLPRCIHRSMGSAAGGSCRHHSVRGMTIYAHDHICTYIPPSSNGLKEELTFFMSKYVTVSFFISEYVAVLERWLIKTWLVFSLSVLLCSFRWGKVIFALFQIHLKFNWRWEWPTKTKFYQVITIAYILWQRPTNFYCAYSIKKSLMWLCIWW